MQDENFIHKISVKEPESFLIKSFRIPYLFFNEDFISSILKFLNISRFNYADKTERTFIKQEFFFNAFSMEVSKTAL